ncbi:YvrJ family protein [Virgibacillus dokdonensis]|uniref:YvrJ family protein n=1 Tax=Virgibacillus dokdonensis TaxID=302167 RepID=UPI00216314B2|nr:YvrJ family protein [Virgibacillus dokdonensis]
MVTDEWITLIGNFGFPIALIIYLFIRFEKKIEKLEKVIVNLSESIRQIKK